MLKRGSCIFLLLHASIVRRCFSGRVVKSLEFLLKTRALSSANVLNILTSMCQNKSYSTFQCSLRCAKKCYISPIIFLENCMLQ